jgi:hypothetical protein
MVKMYSFVEDGEALQKIKSLEETVSCMVKQTMECAIFVQEYMQIGFYGVVSSVWIGGLLNSVFASRACDKGCRLQR